MNQVQANLYKMIKEIDAICSKHNITYYLAGGTALGAVRSNDFIPWDDDMDLYITRSNYEKLAKVIEDELPEGRSFVTKENTPLHFNPIAVYVDDTTTCIYQSRLMAGKACGQVIEFFIFDPVPADEEKFNLYKKMLLIYTELLTPYLLIASNVLDKDTFWDGKLYDYYYKKSLVEGKEKVLKEIEDNFLTFPEEDCAYYSMRWGYRFLIYRKETFGSGRRELFIDTMLPVPVLTEEIFRVAYGDSWMYIPQGDDQVVHNGVKDMDRPYSDFLEISERFIDKEKLLQSYIRYKEKRVELRPMREQTERDVAATRAKVAELTLKREIPYSTAELKEMLDSRRYEELKAILAPYYSVIFMENIKRFGVYINVDDEFLRIVLETLIFSGEYFRAGGILSRRKALDRPLTDQLIKIDEIIDFCHRLSVEQYDYKNIAAVANLLDEGRESYSHLLEFIRANLWVLSSTATSPEGWQQVEDAAKAGLDMYPNDGEILKYLGDVLWWRQERESAVEIYEEATKGTRNGILLLDMQKKTGINFQQMIL